MKPVVTRYVLPSVEFWFATTACARCRDTAVGPAVKRCSSRAASSMPVPQLDAELPI